MKEFERPLVLTGPPLETGQRVKDAQYLLSGHNRFPGLAPYKDGTIDGVYGPVTAAATKRAKFWLGYPLSACNGVFGQTLYEYLRVNDWRPLPDEYRARRQERIAAAARTPGMLALELARTLVGMRESPFGSNCQPFGAWYGFNCVAWCAIFESYCFGHTDRPSFRYSYVGNIVADARAGRNGLREVWTPQPGDIACYRLHGDPFAHTGFVDSPVDAAGEFWDLAGNTGPTSQSNGGEVLRGQQSRSIVSAFVRVG